MFEVVLLQKMAQMMSPKRSVMSPKRGGVQKYEYFQICEPSSDDDMDQLIVRDSFDQRKM